MTISNPQRPNVETPLPPPRVRRYRTAAPRVEPRNRINTALIYIVVAALITAVGLLYLFQTNYVASLGYEMSQLQRERSALALRNEELNYSVARYESLSTIESVAIGQVGMQAAEDQIFLSVPLPAQTELTVPTRVATDDASILERVWRGLTGSATAVSSDPAEVAR